MRRITDFSEVDYFVPVGIELPEEIRQTLKLYIGQYGSLAGQPGTLYHIPHYLQDQWIEKYALVIASGL